mgnify:CR=1 FL=1
MKEQHIITFKKLIENSAWFGVLNYEDKIFVSLKNISSLYKCEIKNNHISLGALMTHQHIAEKLSNIDELQCLKQAVLASANPAIRGMATIGGNICTSDFLASDLVPALIASDAKILFQSCESKNQMPIEQYLKTIHVSFPIQYIRNKETLGTPKNWTAGIPYASGQWIKVMHDDDYFSDADSLNAFANAIDDEKEVIFRRIYKGKINPIEGFMNFLIDVKSKLNTETVVSGSVQVNITATTGFSTFSSSIETRIQKAQKEIEKESKFDLSIINDDLDLAKKESLDAVQNFLSK